MAKFCVSMEIKNMKCCIEFSIESSLRRYELYNKNAKVMMKNTVNIYGAMCKSVVSQPI